MCLGTPTPLTPPGHVPAALAACSQLNTASKRAELHLPCNDGKNFIWGGGGFQKYVFVLLKKLLNLINSICSSSGAFFVSLGFFCLKLLSSPLFFDMTINQLKPLITW